MRFKSKYQMQKILRLGESSWHFYHECIYHSGDEWRFSCIYTVCSFSSRFSKNYSWKSIWYYRGRIMACSNLVPNIKKMMCIKSNYLSTTQELINLSFREDSPSTLTKTPPGCRQSIRRTYSKKGLPQQSISILIASLVESTIKQYNSPLREWWNFCCKLERDPLDIWNHNTYLNFYYKSLMQKHLLVRYSLRDLWFPL